MWIFGYGSLIWKVDFPYERKLVGHIKGYVRRFYQKSTDHRGVPSKPGRVVTLLASADPNDEVWGVAYKIANENIESVVSHLDYREKGGYKRANVLFYPSKPVQKVDPSLLNNSDDGDSDSQPVVPATPSPSEEMPFELTIYIGTEDNPNYAGVECVYDIANQIYEARGPSGTNIEYLYKLATSMRMIAPGVNDDHLFTIESIVKDLEKEKLKDLLVNQEALHRKFDPRRYK